MPSPKKTARRGPKAAPAKPRAKKPAAKKATTPRKSAKGGAAMSASGAGQATGSAASRLIDQRIRELAGWRGKTLAHMRALILEADPEMVEECKWVKPSNPGGVPVWSHAGIVCTGEAYKEAVKLTFARGASLEDPQRLFNAGFDGGTRRAVDLREGEMPDAKAFKALVQAAVEENLLAKGR
jgi:hypothetical protein